MHNTHLIIADADAIVSLINSQDANHTRAVQVLHSCIAHRISLLFPSTAICEATTVLHRKLNNPEGASRVIEKTLSGDFPVHAVGQQELSAAAMLFKPNGSKKNTFFDAIIAAITKQQNADAIFSFDEWYRKLGFTLAEDLFAEEKKAA